MPRRCRPAGSVTLRAREATDRYLLVHELIKRLHERYRAEGIDIPYPVRTVRLLTDAHQNGDRGGLEASRIR